MRVFTGMSIFFRGAGKFYGAIKNASKYFRASLSISGAHFNTYGALSMFPGSAEILRGHCYNLRGGVYYFGE